MDKMIVENYNTGEGRRARVPMLGGSELLELVELERICFPPPQNYSRQTLRRFLSQYGCGLFRWFEEGPSGKHLIAFHMFDCCRAELITLDVLPEHRRRGIGRTLVNTSMARLRDMGHARVTCQIAVTNRPSLTLHETLGFRQTALAENYYGSGRHAFVMTASLRQPLPRG